MNRAERREMQAWRESTSFLGTTSRARRRYRREARRHAAECQRLGLPERAVVWRKRARNG